MSKTVRIVEPPAELVERPNTTLFGIHSHLMELYQLRDDTSVADLPANELKEALDAIDRAIDEHIAAEARKVDSIVIVRRQLAAAAEFNKAEAKRYAARAKMFERDAEDLEARMVRFMEANQLPVLEGRAARLKLMKNPASLNPRQPELIPLRFLRTTVTLALEQWRAIEQGLRDWAQEHENAGNDADDEFALADALHAAVLAGKSEPDKVAIKAEMALPCEKCLGRGKTHLSEFAGDGPGQFIPCVACGGSGKRAVAGCELVDDKHRLAES